MIFLVNESKMDLGSKKASSIVTLSTSHHLEPSLERQQLNLNISNLNNLLIQAIQQAPKTTTKGSGFKLNKSLMQKLHSLDLTNDNWKNVLAKKQANASTPAESTNSKLVINNSNNNGEQHVKKKFELNRSKKPTASIRKINTLVNLPGDESIDLLVTNSGLNNEKNVHLSKSVMKNFSTTPQRQTPKMYRHRKLSSVNSINDKSNFNCTPSLVFTKFSSDPRPPSLILPVRSDISNNTSSKENNYEFLRNDLKTKDAKILNIKFPYLLKKSQVDFRSNLIDFYDLETTKTEDVAKSSINIHRISPASKLSSSVDLNLDDYMSEKTSLDSKSNFSKFTKELDQFYLANKFKTSKSKTSKYKNGIDEMNMDSSSFMSYMPNNSFTESFAKEVSNVRSYYADIEPKHEEVKFEFNKKKEDIPEPSSSKITAADKKYHIDIYMPCLV